MRLPYEKLRSTAPIAFALFQLISAVTATFIDQTRPSQWLASSAGDYFSQTALHFETELDKLRSAVEGRLLAGEPYAKPCFPNSEDFDPEAFDSASCLHVRKDYRNKSEWQK